MVKRWFSFLHLELGGLHQAALLLGGSALASQLLGLLRDRLLAGQFGAGRELDLYYASFRIPDFIFVAVGSLLAVTVLIPMLIEKQEQRKKEETREFLGGMLSFFLLSMVVVSALVIPLLPWLSRTIAPGFSAGEQAHLVQLTMLLLLSPLLLGLSNLFGAVTQSYRRFVVYAISPLLYNLGIIFGVLQLSPRYGLYGLVYGVLIGALLHLLMQIPVVVRAGVFPRLFCGLRLQELRLVLARSLPRTLALGANQVLLIVLLAVASYMAHGSITIFTFAFNLQSVPMALIGVSYSVAAFPQMAKLFAQGEQAAFMSYTREALRHILFWSIPIATLFVVLRAHIVRVILGSGNFSWDDTRLTAAALAIFAIAVVCQSVVQLLDRAYYATGETRTPVVAKIGSAVIAAGLGLLSPWLIEAWPRALDTFALLLRIPNIVGAEILLLPLVFTLAAALNMGYLWWKFATTLRASLWIDVDRTLRESLLASLVMGLTTYVALTLSAGHFDLSHTLTVFLAALFAGVAGMGAGVLVLVHVKSREFSEIAQATHRRLRRILPMLPGPEDLP